MKQMPFLHNNAKSQGSSERKEKHLPVLIFKTLDKKLQNYEGQYIVKIVKRMFAFYTFLMSSSALFRNYVEVKYSISCSYIWNKARENYRDNEMVS